MNLSTNKLHTIDNIFPPNLHRHQFPTHQDQLERVHLIIMPNLPMDTLDIFPIHRHFEYIHRPLPVVVHHLPQVNLSVNRNNFSI